MQLIQTPLSRRADQLSAYYAAHPDLIVSLLTRMGADRIRMMRDEIRSTCPVHQGHNPEALAVWFDKGFPVYKCHTDCNQKGTLSQLVMRKYNATFESAVNLLAQMAGIQINGEMVEVSKQTMDDEDISLFNRRFAIEDDIPNIFPETWVEWSVNQLYQPHAAEYLDYLTGPITATTRWGERKRQLPPYILSRFQLGFVPANVWSWADQKEGFRRGWFEDRISFPWRLYSGQCIGFAGRRVDGGKDQKYKTLPGTKRSFALYGISDPLCVEAIRRTRRLVVLEGYTDLMRAFEHHCYGSVSLGGTELTPRHISFLQSFNLEAIVMYLDPDGPGMIAAQKAAAQLSNLTQVLLATPPGQEDPGELVDYNQFWTPIVQATPFIFKESV